MLAGQDAHRLLVGLPGLRPDPQQLRVDLTLRHPRAIAVVNLQLEELEAGEDSFEDKISEKQVRGEMLEEAFLSTPLNQT